MPIDFHDEKNRFTYASREADKSWVNFIESIVDVKGKEVLDIGCGGGIYSKQFAKMGAKHVTGIDFSLESLRGAKVNCADLHNISFQKGDALQTGLASDSFDIVLERAVIHHLKELSENASEIYRVLRKEGLCIIQDRTPEDCFLPGSDTHIRGYFFEKNPRLKKMEEVRRHKSEAVKEVISQAGFQDVKEHQLWEIRKIYDSKEALLKEILARTGRSILHELSDSELQDLAHYISQKLEDNRDKIFEQDRWTIWTAIK